MGNEIQTQLFHLDGRRNIIWLHPHNPNRRLLQLDAKLEWQLLPVYDSMQIVMVVVLVGLISGSGRRILLHSIVTENKSHILINPQKLTATSNRLPA